MTWPTLTEEQTDALAKLRAPFPPESINKLPRVTCGDCSKKQCNKHQRAKCNACGAYVSTQHIHLDFVGHAALTDRLLSVDPGWTWEPFARDQHGAPLLERDQQGRPIGLWIRLYVAGMDRPGYGSVEAGKGEAVKELIGDALRNAGMRFGCALDLWHKGDLPHDDEPNTAPVELATLDELVREAQSKSIDGDYQAMRAWAAKSAANRDAAEAKLRKMLADSSGGVSGEAATSEANVPAGASPSPTPAGSGGGDITAAAPPPSPSPDPSTGWDVDPPKDPVPYDWRAHARQVGVNQAAALSAGQKALAPDLQVRGPKSLDDACKDDYLASLVKEAIDKAVAA
jgi:hypothetical protein